MMNIAQSIRRVMIVAVFALIAVAASAAETAGERYIVILKSRSGPAPDVARLGGTITFRQEEQLNVTLPREALAALHADPLVRYIQAVAGADGAPLAGEPEEPTPGARRRLVPHATAGSQSWSRSYSYDDSGNITNIGDQQFVYDALGRLGEMATAGTATETYEYDRYGNQTKRTTGGVEHPIATDTATNRLSTGYSYDPGGNLTSGNSYTLTYDALGQAATKTYTATTTFNETYVYTAAEERIGVQTSNTGETSSWWYWSVRDEGGKVLRQYRSSALDPTQTALWIEDYVYRDGLLVGAERPPTLGGRRHFHLDHLGSPRLITSNDGQIVSSHDYLPFGGETTSIYQETGAGFDREDPMKFTGQERDYPGGYGREVGGDAIDYMHARYYSGNLGRFLSPDQLYGNLEKPQTWNRYVYALDSPMNFADPLGLAATKTSRGSAPGNVDCPPGTEGISCFTTTAPDPGPPQLPNAPIARQAFFWDRAGEKNFVYRYFVWGHKVGDPIVNFLNGGCGRVVQCGTVAIGSLNSAPMSALANVQDAELANVVDQNYRPNAAYGDGGTADVIRYEIRTGQLVSKTGHAQKGRETITAIGRIMAAGRLNAADRQIAIELASDLLRALMGN
jgi:RHS repeat-associated protein